MYNDNNDNDNDNFISPKDIGNTNKVSTKINFVIITLKIHKEYNTS